MVKTPPSSDLSLRRLQADLLLALTRIRRQTERLAGERLEAAKLEVTSAQANAMLALFQARRPMTARQLAEALGVTEVTVARFVKALEAGAWVARVPDPSDARAMLLSPTKKARDALPRFIAVSNAMLDAAFAGFERAELDALAAVVERIRANLGA